MALSEIVARLEVVESELLNFLQEVRSIKAELQKKSKVSPSIESLLDADEVAKILGVDIAYIYTQARSGKMPSIKLGKYRKFSPSQLKKWLDRKNGALL